jgi:hypothetical protein
VLGVIASGGSRDEYVEPIQDFGGEIRGATRDADGLDCLLVLTKLKKAQDKFIDGTNIWLDWIRGDKYHWAEKPDDLAMNDKFRKGSDYVYGAERHEARHAAGQAQARRVLLAAPGHRLTERAANMKPHHRTARETRGRHEGERYPGACRDISAKALTNWRVNSACAVIIAANQSIWLLSADEASPSASTLSQLT